MRVERLAYCPASAGAVERTAREVARSIADESVEWSVEADGLAGADRVQLGEHAAAVLVGAQAT